MDGTYHTGRIHDQHQRNGKGLVRSYDPLFGISKQGVLHVETRRLRCDIGQRPSRDADHGQFVAEPILPAIQFGADQMTHAAPRRPEVEHHNVPSQRRPGRHGRSPSGSRPLRAGAGKPTRILSSTPFSSGEFSTLSSNETAWLPLEPLRRSNVPAARPRIRLTRSSVVRTGRPSATLRMSPARMPAAVAGERGMVPVTNTPLLAGAGSTPIPIHPRFDTSIVSSQLRSDFH